MGLELVRRPERDPREPPFRIGDVVQINSGGPPSLVVDLLPNDRITIAWRDHMGGISECSFPAVCCERLHLV